MAILLQPSTPSDGYKLVADYCQHYDPRYGNGLNGPSKRKVEQITRFVATVEAREDQAGRGDGRAP